MESLPLEISNNGKYLAGRAALAGVDLTLFYIRRMFLNNVY